MPSHFNPHSAFPRQSTFTPDAGFTGIQRAINAPDFGAVGTGRVMAQRPLDSAYLNVARNAANIANGAAGSVQQVRGLQGRPGLADNYVDRLHQRGAALRNGVATNARRQMMGMSQPRPGGDLANEMLARGAGVVQSAATPLSATTPLSTPSDMARFGRPREPYDSLLDAEEIQPRTDGPNRWTPEVTSRARPKRAAPF